MTNNQQRQLSARTSRSRSSRTSDFSQCATTHARSAKKKRHSLASISCSISITTPHMRCHVRCRPPFWLRLCQNTTMAYPRTLGTKKTLETGLEPATPGFEDQCASIAPPEHIFCREYFLHERTFALVFVKYLPSFRTEKPGLLNWLLQGSKQEKLLASEILRSDAIFVNFERKICESREKIGRLFYSPFRRK